MSRPPETVCERLSALQHRAAHLRWWASRQSAIRVIQQPLLDASVERTTSDGCFDAAHHTISDQSPAYSWLQAVQLEYDPPTEAVGINQPCPCRWSSGWQRWQSWLVEKRRETATSLEPREHMPHARALLKAGHHFFLVLCVWVF